MRLTLRQRRWIALFALFGLLFQQAAMANYLCPLQLPSEATASSAPACHAGKLSSVDKQRCHTHCHAITTSAEQPPAFHVPMAAVLLGAVQHVVHLQTAVTGDICARAIADRHAPPLRTRYCSLTI